MPTCKWGGLPGQRQTPVLGEHVRLLDFTLNNGYADTNADPAAEPVLSMADAPAA